MIQMSILSGIMSQGLLLEIAIIKLEIMKIISRIKSWSKASQKKFCKYTSKKII